ncbi:MAG TPA: glycosyltransferase [Cyclobacteriaceae bacterium]|nr:glycosyltransferase [Cyclobacteriaceae bacterium]
MTSGKTARIAIIIPGGIGTGRGNIGVPVLERQVMLLAKEFDVVVLSLFKVSSDYQPQNFQIISIPAKGFLFKTWRLFNAFRRLNKNQKFDVIHGFWALPSGFLAVIIGRFFNVPSVVSVLGGDAISLPKINYGQLRHFIPRVLVRWTILNAGTATALTRYLEKNLQTHGIRRQDIRILPWGIDNHQFPYRPCPVKVPVSFLHIGNLNRVKDQLTLLKAFKLIADQIDCHLNVIGEGPLEHNLREWITTNGLSDNVTLKRPVDYKDVAAFYQQAMILLHTSLSEGQSEVVTEAMSSGVVVCGTQVGLMSDLPSCCVAVPTENPEALGDEVLKLIRDEKRIASIRRNAQEWTHSYNIAWTVNATATMYREQLTQKLTADT